MRIQILILGFKGLIIRDGISETCFLAFLVVDTQM